MNNKTKNGIKRLRSKNGMTLVEVLVAMTLLVLIIMVFTPLFMTYFRNTRTAGQITRKTYERSSIMERLIANPDGSNDTGYETAVANMPITLSAGSTTIDFSNTGANSVGNVHGTMVSESLNDEKSYVSFYTPSTGSTMVCFPANLTDDFITKDITVVPKGFKFHASAENKSAVTGYHFEVYNTKDDGTKEKVSTNYYDIAYANDGDGGKVAIFTFKGANNVISFERSPLWIQYCGNGGMLYQVKVEIGAPEIILVGEKADDGNYYYYATEGVDVKTGKMDIVAKKMSGAPLISAMNDVEWVAKGRGDDGNGGVNQYGYYVMGGDAGQVRRFWRNETTGNYYWGGDVLGQYDRYYYITADNTADGSSHETITQTNTTQAQFKSIFRSSQGYFKYNGVDGANQLTADELITIGFEYRMITSNYYTANVTNSDTYFTTVGRALAIKNSDGYSARYAGCGTELYDKEKGLTTGFVSFRQDANSKLYTWLDHSGYGSELDIDGYKAATNYEYTDDPSLITITSVGAVQINTSNPNYYQSNQTSVLGQQLYPTQSYTLYCGTIPAVIDTWGWKTKNIGSLLYNNYSMWLHTGTLGIATDGNKWYPTGKFGDTRSAATTSDVPGQLSSSLFGTNANWFSLLNYGTEPTRYPFGASETPKYKDYDNQYAIRVTYDVEYECYYLFGGWKNETGLAENVQLIKPGDVGKTNSSYRTGELKDGTGGTTRNIRITNIRSSQVYINNRWVDTDDYKRLKVEGGNRIVLGNEISGDDNTVIISKTDDYQYQYRKPHQDGVVVSVTNAKLYYGPNGSGGEYATSGSLSARSYLGTALPYEGTDYYVTAGHEVDITMGYLSQPYAIDTNNPTVPKMSGLSGLTGGSDFYFKKPGDGIGSSILSGGAFNHSFVSGGLRDNVTMLDVKSFHDDLTGNNISLAAGYSLSYVANDYSYLTRLGQVLNNGVVYIRATGDGTENDTTGDLASGKGWSLKKETNVFHQFFGIDQYRGVSIGDGAGTSAILGWNTTYHKGYLNMSTDSNKAPQPSYSPSITTGNQNYGVNYHPLMDTECTTVNWGTTSDMKPQAMWGTANGTLLSWYYNYESVKDSKIYSVCKEFENYSWCDKFGIKPNTDTYKKQYYDYTTVDRGIYNDYGFVSVLKNINDICFCDDVWVAVGDQSGKKPSDYSAPKSYNYLGATGEAGSYVNVKFLDKDLTGSDGLPIARWIHVKISEQTNINFKSVVNCQGVWYIMGYVDVNNNGIQDTGDRCVMYFSRQPQDGFTRCATRTDLDGNYTGKTYNDKTYALYFDESGVCQDLELTGVNKMACQS